LTSLSGVAIDLSLGNQLGTDTLTIARKTPNGTQTIEFACFKIRQVTLSGTKRASQFTMGSNDNACVPRRASTATHATR
jgi:hypothetical protein